MHLQAGDIQKAEEDLPSVEVRDRPLYSLAQRMCWAARLELDLARGQAVEAQEKADQILASLERIIQTSAFPEECSLRESVLRLWLLRGETLTALGRYPEAKKDLLSALQISRA